MTESDLLASEIRETAFSGNISARGFLLKLPRLLVVTFCFPPESVVENLILLEDYFPLGLILV